MSKNINKKKYQKKRRRHNIPWPLAALGGLLLLVSVFFFANRPAVDGGGTPDLTVDQPSIDYGYVKFGEDRQIKVKVTNTGDGVLRFKEKPYIEILEGC